MIINFPFAEVLHKLISRKFSLKPMNERKEQTNNRKKEEVKVFHEREFPTQFAIDCLHIKLPQETADKPIAFDKRRNNDKNII